MSRKPLAALALLALAGAAGAAAADAPYVTNDKGIDRRNLDTSVSPCVDFFQYANGGWISRNPIPADQPAWSIGAEMRERNYVLLRDILDEAAKAGAPAGSNKQRVGDYWRAAMDTATIEKQGKAPLEPVLRAIDALKTPADVAAFVRGRLAVAGSTVLGMGVLQDLQQSDRYILYATQGGLGLPDRDYYTRTDDESKTLRDEYQAHIARMLRLLGEPQAEAETAARDVLALETRLANASLGSIELRDPANYYNLKTPAEADALTPHFSWTALFKELGVSGPANFSFAHPKFFAEMDKALGDVPLSTWKSYLRWQAVHEAASYLSDAFVDESFAFFGKRLQGVPELQPRWKRMVDDTSGSLGEALGEVYVERAFTPATKERADAMVKALGRTIHDRLSNVQWMSEPTRKQALAKLATFTPKIGYPDRWRDYSALTIGRTSFLGNAQAASVFELHRQLAKLGKPIDRSEWGMSPQTINAYYNPLQNEIVFPAAIMQPPRFAAENDDALNFGGMGGVIGHEYMHGFDDTGSRFDAQGNMKSWWTDEDRKRFEERTQKLVQQYDRFEPVPGVHVQGKLTLGENIGDLAGVTMAYYALESTLAGKERKPIDGFTPEQRFFLAFAQGWRRHARPEFLKLQVNTDVHSPSQYRTNGPLQNMPEFAKAFGCKEGDPMVLPASQRAEIW